MFRLLPETENDSDEVEWLFDTAFAPGRTALSSYRLRDGIAPVAKLSRIARDEFDVIGGAVRYWPIRIGHQ
ncbi:MAG: GNAT family N-acetyltransferase, partial [Pseudomonadota bacterium]